jgi:acyl carrier protein
MSVNAAHDAAAPSADDSEKPANPSVPGGATAPRDPLEAQLKALWERVLDVHDLGVTTDFFDAGGHSLLAARLLAEVEKEFRIKLPLACLMQYPTVETFATQLRAERPREPAPRAPAGDVASRLEGKWKDPVQQVFSMRRAGTLPPLFVVDAGPFQRPLVRHLSDDQPVFGIALPELTALPDGFTVKDIAANLVEALCQFGVGGPYHLAGWSQAGLIAYEMAQQLRARGEEVGLLVLFDTNNPTYPSGCRCSRGACNTWSRRITSRNRSTPRWPCSVARSSRPGGSATRRWGGKDWRGAGCASTRWRGSTTRCFSSPTCAGRPRS